MSGPLRFLRVSALLSVLRFAGASCAEAAPNADEEGHDEQLSCWDGDLEQSLHLIQRHARAKEAKAERDHSELTGAVKEDRHEKARPALLPTATRIDLALCGLLGLVPWPSVAQQPVPKQHVAKQSLAQSWASRLLTADSLAENLQSWVKELREVPQLLRRNQNTGWAAVILSFWGVLFCTLVSYFLHSVLCARAARSAQDADSRVSCKGSAERADASSFLEKADQVSWWQCLTFSWMDTFLRGEAFDIYTSKSPTAGALKQAWQAEVRQRGALKASLWRALFKAVSRRSLVLLLAFAWVAAFLEFIGMVLALDVILFLLEREAKREAGVDALQTSTAVLALLFVLPLAYRFLSSAVCMLDGQLASVISADVTALLYEKSLRLPAGCMYHSHVSAGEGAAGTSQLAATMAASAAQEWPQMFKTLALLSAAPLVGATLLALLIWHMGLPGLLGFAYILPGSCIAILVVKWAISWRHEYQLCQGLRLRWLRALTSSRRAWQSLGFQDAMCRKICAAREQELASNENYSVVVSLLIANLHSVVWLVVVGSLFSSVLMGVGPGRNCWVVLQIVASLQACSSLVISGLRRALCLPSSLQRLECFLKQPEMPVDVVRPPALHLGAPLVHVSGNFSFEEGGPLVLRDLDFSLQRGECVALLGASGSGKTALLQAILGELFPCGLSFVSATQRRSYVAQDPWISRASLEAAVGEKFTCADGLQGFSDGPSPSDLTPSQRARLMLSTWPATGVQELMLLDDALSLLDPAEAEAMLDASVFSTAAKNAGRIVAMANPKASHLKHCDRVVLLGRGRILAQGPPDEVLSSSDLCHLLPLARGTPCLQSDAKQAPSAAPARGAFEEEAPEASPEPLSVMKQALLRQLSEPCSVDLRSSSGRLLEQADGMPEMGKSVVSWLQAAGYGQLLLAVTLVFLQRCAQLAQLLVLARWGDSAMSPYGCDHKTFAIGLLVALAFNTVLLVASESACSRVARESSQRIHRRLLANFCQRSSGHSGRVWKEAFTTDLAHVDSVVLSSLLSGLRSLLGTVLQQAYILSIAPQWLACVVLLPLYACICYFSQVYLSASGLAARTGRLFLAEAQDVMDETLTDPVSVRANLLGAQAAARVASSAKASAAFSNVFPAASRSWVCFRVALCLSFAASACALHVLLCDEARHVGVGSLGLIVSLLFAFLGDCEAAAEVGGQAAVALGALGRLLRLTRGLAATTEQAASHELRLEDREISISSEEMPTELLLSESALCDGSGPLLRAAPGSLELASGRSLAELAANLADWQDYCIISVDKVAFDAQAMAEALAASRHPETASKRLIALGLRHSSVARGLSVSFADVSVSFGGPGLGRSVLTKLSFEVASGAHVGVLGPSGSGKSTLLAAAAGFLQCGGVRVQGQLSRETFPGLIGFVAQEPVVWEGTWRDNLDLDGRFSDDALWAVLQGVDLDTLAAAKAQGLDAVLVDGGSLLSLEQRYLLNLARVALRRPPLLLLDECTSVQTASACQMLQAVLNCWFQHSTVLAAVTTEAQAAAMGLSETLHLRSGCISR